jgi:hypothetical protein
MRTGILILTIVVALQPAGPFPMPARKSFSKTASNSPVPTPIFKDVAEQTGLRFRQYNGMTGKFYLPEIMGSGAALFDFDNDGDLDVFLIQETVLEPGVKPGDTTFPWRGPEPPRSRLFRNDLVIANDGAQQRRWDFHRCHYREWSGRSSLEYERCFP